tara:strand:+ start:1337 stop:2248 length:912 start_codon:yes stop_codon:yes gene_type:complete
MYLLTNKKLKAFREKGILEFNELLNKNKCNKLYKKILNNRIWGKNLFKTEKNFLKNPQYRKTNPGKGKCNLAEKFDLSFIEKNKEIKRTLNKILGDEYDIVLKKFVVAVPEHWIPGWLKKKIKNSLAANLGPFIKKKYRDVTYFRGIDYHMDQIDFPNQTSDFITLYIYLNDTSLKMSPLNIIEKSHIFGATVFPHVIKNSNNNNYLRYGKNLNKLKVFKKKKLVGKKGTVYIWTSLTLHGTQPQKREDEFRISLRYLVKKSPNCIKITEIDNLIKNSSTINKTRNDINFKNFKQIKFNKILK